MSHRDAREPVPCRSCKALMVWATIEDSGKACPFDAMHNQAEGTHVLLYLPATNSVIARAVERGSSPLGRVSHFTTCPDASAHSHKRGGAPKKAGDLLPKPKEEP
jgi:hypothetical protein